MTEGSTMPQIGGVYLSQLAVNDDPDVARAGQVALRQWLEGVKLAASERRIADLKRRYGADIFEDGNETPR